VKSRVEAMTTVRFSVILRSVAHFFSLVATSRRLSRSAEPPAREMRHSDTTVVRSVAHDKKFS
jgi:hypothetical protein